LVLFCLEKIEEMENIVIITTEFVGFIRRKK